MTVGALSYAELQLGGLSEKTDIKRNREGVVS